MVHTRTLITLLALAALAAVPLFGAHDASDEPLSGGGAGGGPAGGADTGPGVDPDTSPVPPGSTRSTRAALSWTRFHGNDENTGVSEAIAPRTADILWEVDIGKEVYSSPAVSNGRVYFAAHDKLVHCVGLETGDEIWTYAMGDKMYSSPTVAEGLVFIGSGIEVSPVSTKMVALDAATGDEVWVFDTPNSVYGSAAVKGGTAYFGDADGWFYAVDAAGNGDGTTSVKWSFHTGGPIWSTPAFKGKDVLFNGGPCCFYRVNGDTGAIKLNVSTPLTYDGLLASPTIAGNKVLVGSAKQPEGMFYCFDIDTGAQLWNFSTGSSAYGVSATPAVHDGTVFMGSNNGIMYALDVKDGAEKWTVQTGNTIDGIYSSPVVAEGLVMFGSSDRKFYALEEETGEEVWSYTADPATYGISSSPASVDRKVIVGTGDGRVICFGKASDTTFELRVEVMVLESWPVQTAVKVMATTMDGSPLEGVGVVLAGDHLTFDQASGVTDALGIHSTGFSEDILAKDTVVQIHAAGTTSGFLPQDAYVNYTIAGTPPAPLVISPSPTTLWLAPGMTDVVGIGVTANGVNVSGARVVFSLPGDSGLTLDPPNYVTTNPDGKATLNITAGADTTVRTVTIAMSVTMDGYLNGSAGYNVTVDPVSPVDGTDGTDGADGTDGTADGDDGGGSADDAGTVEVGGSSIALSTLIGLVVVVIIAVVFIILIVVAKKGGGDDDDGEGTGVATEGEK